MGLFDTVLPEIALPDVGAAAVEWWQTKTFDAPMMEKYRITAEGRLLKERVHYEGRSDPNAEGLMALAGMMTSIHEGWDDTNFHGVLNFYGSTPEHEWFEYFAKFTDGTFVSIERAAPPTENG